MIIHNKLSAKRNIWFTFPLQKIYNMKKVLSLTIALIGFAAMANAQTFTHKFDVTLLSPGNSTVNTSQNYAFGDTLRIILTQGNLTSSDTLAVTNVVGTSSYTLTNLPRLQGDTIYIAKQDTIGIPAAPGVYPYCVRAFLLDRSNPSSFSSLISANFDTTGSRSCVDFTAVIAASVNDRFTVVDNGASVKVNIFPNPVTGSTIGMDFVSQNASEVTAKVYDLTGRTVISHTFGNAYKGQDNFRLNVDELNSGMYILELRQGGVKATGQFIK